MLLNCQHITKSFFSKILLFLCRKIDFFFLKCPPYGCFSLFFSLFCHFRAMKTCSPLRWGQPCCKSCLIVQTCQITQWAIQSCRCGSKTGCAPCWSTCHRSTLRRSSEYWPEETAVSSSRGKCRATKTKLMIWFYWNQIYFLIRSLLALENVICCISPLKLPLWDSIQMSNGNEYSHTAETKMIDCLIFFYFIFFYFRVQDLNSTISSLDEVTQKEIHNHIIQTLKGKVSTQEGNQFNSFQW